MRIEIQPFHSACQENIQSIQNDMLFRFIRSRYTLASLKCGTILITRRINTNSVGCGIVGQGRPQNDASVIQVEALNGINGADFINGVRALCPRQFLFWLGAVPAQAEISCFNEMVFAV